MMPSKEIKVKKDGRSLREYTCPYPRCGEVFRRTVTKWQGGGKRQSLSTPVKCPRCKAYLPTWE